MRSFGASSDEPVSSGGADVAVPMLVRGRWMSGSPGSEPSAGEFCGELFWAYFMACASAQQRDAQRASLIKQAQLVEIGGSPAVCVLYPTRKQPWAALTPELDPWAVSLRCLLVRTSGSQSVILPGK
jgi:hypothetical protein